GGGQIVLIIRGQCADVVVKRFNTVVDHEVGDRRGAMAEHIRCGAPSERSVELRRQIAVVEVSDIHIDAGFLFEGRDDGLRHQLDLNRIATWEPDGELVVISLVPRARTCGAGSERQNRTGGYS